MTDKVQKIRKGIEILKSQLIKGACASQVAMETRCKEEAYNEVLAILDSLQEKPVSEDLEEEFDDIYYKLGKENSQNTGLGGFYHGYNFSLKIARHFAKWQKEQMMASGTDVTVHVEAGNYPYIPQMELYDYDKDIPLAKEGDRYKVILIKED